MQHAGGDGRRDGIAACIAMEMSGEEGEIKNDIRLQQRPAEGGSFPVLAQVYYQDKV